MIHLCCALIALQFEKRGCTYVDLNHWTSALYFMGLFGMGNNVVSFDGLGQNDVRSTSMRRHDVASTLI